MISSGAMTKEKPHLIGIAADHGGFELKQHLAGMMREAGHEVIDFGDPRAQPDDDYPDFVVPLARAVARGEVNRGIAICGSGVGASAAASSATRRRGGWCRPFSRRVSTARNAIAAVWRKWRNSKANQRKEHREN